MESKYSIKHLIKKMKSMRSLKARIFIIIITVGMISGLVMGMGILQNYESRAIASRSESVQNQLKIIANHLITYSYLQDPSSEVIGAELAMLASSYDGRVLIINGDFRIIKDTYGISEGRTIISEEVIRCFKGENISNYDEESGYIEITTPIIEIVQSEEESSGQTKVVKGVMVTSVSTDNVIMTVDWLTRKATVFFIMTLAIVITAATAIATGLTKPFDKVTKAINEVKEGVANEAIPVQDYSETVHIIEAFNQLYRRMRVLDESRQEFVSNVSHELKTPLTSMKVLADSLLMQPDTPAEMYREFMEDIASEIDRENQIITDLLSLVKMDRRVAKLNVTEVDINGLIEMILKRLRPIARKKNIEVVFESIRPVLATVDEVKMTLIISNLVENAIKYNKEQGAVKVTLDADHEDFIITIEDTGIGIPKDDIEHIYERFYRVDKSHSREIGGTGLGLAITRNAVLMHRGSIYVESVVEEGTVFIVKIPLKYIVP